MHRTLLITLLFCGLLAGCRSAPPPPAPAPADLGVDPHYERAYVALRTHPAVQAFAAEHLAPSEPLAIEVAAEVIPADYGAVAADLAATPDRIDAVRDSLAALATAASSAPSPNRALPVLSMRQSRPLVLFFSPIDGNRLGAQLYPNPYRRRSFASVREGTPGLALLVEFEDGEIVAIYSGDLEP